MSTWSENILLGHKDVLLDGELFHARTWAYAFL